MSVAEQVITPYDRPAGFLALMRNRNYALLWWSQAISQIGDRFHWIAISLWVYARTGSALSVSYAIISLAVGPAVVGLFAGVVADRWDRKKTMILADIVRAILVGLLPWLIETSMLLVYADLFLVSCASAFFRPAMLAMIQQSVPKKDLMPANSFFMTMDTGTEIAGPALAGVVIATTGYGTALYIDAVSYLFSALLIVLIASPLISIERDQKRVRVWNDLIDGFKFIRNDGLQFGLFMLIFLTWWPSALDSLQTPLAKGALRLSDQQFGWMNSIWGIGFVSASLILGWYGSSFRRGSLIVFSLFGWIIASAIFGRAQTPNGLFSLAFLVGFFNVLLVIVLSTILMEATPPALLGRVLSIRKAALTLVRIASMLIFGTLADLFGVRDAIVGMGGVSLVGLGLGLVLFPQIWASSSDQEPVVPRASRWPLSPVPIAFLKDLLALRVDPAYEPLEQRRLNSFVLSVIATVLVAFFVVDAESMLYLLATVAAGGLCVAVLKPLRARFEAQGSKNLRHPSAPQSKEEIEKRGRITRVTGPTTG